ncbi:Stp1/IreP family PP2C-type Ser/Thr phosphatase [Acidobacteria bacterium AH-259-G07]|nr:Stp1/IreP family PP2C-type Ser/Thr phosphatase [Acidobacteria bacterium AH-259-G07]
MGSDVYQKGSIRFVYRARSDVGRVRKNNEDCLIEAPEMGLFGVCDGLGGHAAGEIASSIAAATLKELVKEVSESPAEALKHGIQEANKRILQDQVKNPRHRGMGTTVTSLYLVPDNAAMVWIAHVGDSRIYLQQENQLSQITEDHSPVFRLYKQGLLTKEQMQRHPQKNLLDRSLGILPWVKIDVFSASLSSGDRFLICSDGLTDSLSDEDIRSILTSCSLDEAVDELIGSANDKGGSDNITLVLVKILEIGGK